VLSAVACHILPVSHIFSIAAQAFVAQGYPMPHKGCS